MQPVRGWLDYHAIDGCPGEYTFRAQVQARTANLVLTPVSSTSPAGDPRTYVVRLQRADGGYSGTLEVIAPPAPSTRNVLTAPTCDEVVAGLAIVAALGADKPESLPEAEPPPPPPASSPSPLPTAPPIADPPPDDDRARERKRSLLALSPEARWGYGPSLAPGLGIWAGHHQSRGLAWRAGVAGAYGGTAGQANDRATFWAIVSEGEVCPLLGPRSSLEPLLCASIEAGVVSSTAASGESSLRPWLAPGMALRLFVPLGGWFIEPSLAARVPLVRDRYWVRPDSLLFETPVVVGQGAVSFGFPL